MKQGKVESLWRYPVKSLLGESLQAVELDQRGVIGDRLYAVSDEQGKLGSGKSTRRFRRIDGLFSMSSKIINGDISICFADGEIVSRADKNINDKLSAKLGQTVTLTLEKSISHFDEGAVHIITTEGLTKLKSFLPDSIIDERRFRANVLLDTKLSDDELIERTLKIGNVKLKVAKKTERCRMVTMAQDNLNDDAKILRVIATNYGLNFGVYASVVDVGYLSIGDHIEIV